MKSGDSRDFTKKILTFTDYLLESLSLTLFRPTPTLVASTLMLGTFLFTLIISSHYGYEFNYLPGFVGYIAGYFVGLVAEWFTSPSK